MAYRFHYSCNHKDYFGSGEDFLGITGNSYHGVWGVSNGRLYQLRPDGKQLPIALTQDVSYYLGDFYECKILYRDGCLTCTEIPDLGFTPDHRYSDDSGKEQFTVHAMNTSTQKEYWIDYAGTRYPVREEKDAIFVYRPSGTGYTPLARSLRTAEGEWDIWMDYVPSPILCLAICVAL